MPKIEKTVFISYRRTDVFVARAVYQYLHSRGYDVFYDYESINAGDFKRIIDSNIESRAHFVLILTPTALDRCDEPDDFLRHEIEHALDQKRNVVPLMFQGFDFGSERVREKLNGKLADLSKYNGLEVPAAFFNEAMERLCERYLEVEVEAVVHPRSVEAQKAAARQNPGGDESTIYAQMTARLAEFLRGISGNNNRGRRREQVTTPPRMETVIDTLNDNYRENRETLLLIHDLLREMEDYIDINRIDSQRKRHRENEKRLETARRVVGQIKQISGYDLAFVIDYVLAMVNVGQPQSAHDYVTPHAARIKQLVLDHL